MSRREQKTIIPVVKTTPLPNVVNPAPVVENCRGFADGSYTRLRKLHGLITTSFEELHLCNTGLSTGNLDNFIEEKALKQDTLTREEPQIILVFNSQNLHLTGPIGGSTETDTVHLRIGILEYQIAIKLHKSITPTEHVHHLGSIILEKLTKAPQTYQMYNAIRQLLAKVDSPNIAGLVPIYQDYLERKRSKRIAEIKRYGPVYLDYFGYNIDKLPDPERETIRNAYFEDYKTALNQETVNPLTYSGSEFVLQLILACRGVGPKEVCFTYHYLTKARYRILSPYSPEARLALIKKLAIPDSIKRKSVQESLNVPLREDTNTQATQTMDMPSTKKTSFLNLRLKLLGAKLWQKNFEKSVKSLLRQLHKLQERFKLKAAAEPSEPAEPRGPPSINFSLPVSGNVSGEGKTNDNEFKAEMMRITAELNRQNETLLKFQTGLARALEPSPSKSTEDVRLIVNKEIKNVEADLKQLVSDFQNIQSESLNFNSQIDKLNLRLNDSTTNALSQFRSYSEDIKEIKMSTAEMQRSLGEARQQTVLLENNSTQQYLELREKLIPALESKLMQCKKDIKSEVENLTETLIKKEAEQLIAMKNEFSRLSATAMEINSQLVKSKNESEGIMGKIQTDYKTLADNMKTTIESQSRELKQQVENLPVDFIKRGHQLESICNTIRYDYEQLRVTDFTRAMEATEKIANKITKSLPDVESRMREISLFLGEQEKVTREAQLLVQELKSTKVEAFHKLAEAQRTESNKQRLSVEKHRRQGKSSKSAKIAAKRDYIERKQEQTERSIGEEPRDIPTITSYIGDWGSLKEGDIFLFRGQKLIVDAEFNPSIRVIHSGQNGDKWEAQKLANWTWYCRNLRKENR